MAEEASFVTVLFSPSDRASSRLVASSDLLALRDAGERAGSPRTDAALLGVRRCARRACDKQRDSLARVTGIGMCRGHDQRETRDQHLYGAHRQPRPQRHVGYNRSCSAHAQGAGMLVHRFIRNDAQEQGGAAGQVAGKRRVFRSRRPVGGREKPIASIEARH